MMGYLLTEILYQEGKHGDIITWAIILHSILSASTATEPPRHNALPATGRNAGIL